MGEVIRKGAAADDVIDDVRATLTHARAKGGVWKTAAEEKLGTVEKLIDLVLSREREAREALAPLDAAVAAEDHDADNHLGHVSDDIWNKVGRPAMDPVLSIIFPGGIAFYTEGSDDEQPDRMDLLAEFLDAGLHPRLDEKDSRAHAKSVRERAERYRKKIEARKKPAARVKLLGAMKTAIARYAQVELSNLKRRYKSENLSESDIHTVIPDRSRPAAAKPRTPTPPDPPPQPA